ncbi:O-antigen ligase [Thalassotalea sp. PS06]|uniref:O-antigen ligase family protein n=1 Tax=Thalassotalea sp. PS06 TaxID=2594005 RepID=UPI00163D84DF|nr:O-antigen ligase family protein [Thalassotalea sp. PS06]
MLILMRPSTGLLGDYSYLMNGFIALSASVLCVYLIIKDQKFRCSRAYLYFILISVVGDILNLGLNVSFSEYVRLFSILSFQVLAINFITNYQSFSLAKITFLGSLIPLGFGFFQLAVGDYYNFYETRGGTDVSSHAIRSIFVHPNAFGVYLVAIFSLLFSYALFVKPQRKFFYIAIGALLFAVVLTKARVAYVGIASIVLFYLTFKYGKKNIILWVIALIVVIMASSLFYEEVISSGKGIRSIMWRLDLWHRLFSMVELKDYLFGAGSDASTYYITQKLNIAYVSEPHNDYLRVFINAGVFGLIFYFAPAFILIFRCLTKRVCSGKIMIARFLGGSLSAAFVVMSITDNIYSDTNFQIVFWGIVVISSFYDFQHKILSRKL